MAPFDLVIRGATVQTASDSFVADIGVAEGRIAALGHFDGPARTTVDARGLVAVPGGVDAHTHFDMPYPGGSTADDFESGTRAALCGGTTTVIDFATQARGGSLLRTLDAWHAKAEGRCWVDYAFHMAVTDLSAKASREMSGLVRQGVTSFKLYMAYPGVLMSDDAAILRALRRSNELGALVSLHCEDGVAIAELVRRARAAGDLAPRFHALTRPAALEAEAVRRAAALAETAAAPVYIVHLSSRPGLEEVRRGRARGLRLLAETCPQYLYLDEREYDRPGPQAARCVISPPLRAREHGEALWKALAAGEFQAVATDHCSFAARSRRGKPGKDRGAKDFSLIPTGAPGAQTRMALMWEAVQKGRISAARFVELTSAGPAKVFGLYPRKGSLAPGADADIVLMDPKRRTVITAAELEHAVDYTPFEGVVVHGAVREVFLRGRRACSGGRPLGRPGAGRYLARGQRQFCL
ncbi:MAG: dihydropyrimidinase [Elusimicrobia bacterium]|nr:dihydropyrimidinase [Elusimicrobiota bacterium]